MPTCKRIAVVWLIAAAAASAQTTPDTMPVNTWLDVPNTHMRAVGPTDGQFAGTWGTGGPANVIMAWGGAALDTKRHRLVLWGGGHSDYYGNELYAFDIPTLTWSRLNDPTINPTLSQELNADGTPNSRHTYGGLAYLAHVDRFFGQGGSCAGNGYALCTRTWVFDFDTKHWTDRQPATTPGGGFGINCSYDPTTHLLWWGSTSSSFAGLWSYFYDTNTWTKRNSDDFYEYTSAIDTLRGQLVVVGKGEIFSYDLAHGDYTRTPWTTTGGSAFIAHGKPGFDYDPTTDRFVGWDGGAVYSLDPVTKAWTAFNPTGAPTPTGLGSGGPGYETGIYGRWRYVPSVNAFVLVTSADDDVHFYKFSTGTGTPDPPPPSSGLTSFQLVSPAAGTQPFSVGLGFKKGDVPGAPTLDLATAQVVVKSRWNDGSVKHAIASGRAALTASTPLTVHVSAGSAASATNLTAADIQAANPSASVALGGYGTVSLAGLLASPFRTWISGPEMVEAHYRSAVGSDPTLVVWFHVRLWKGGRMWVRAVVENGYLDVATADKTYVPSVSVGGTTVFTNGGAALAHHAHTRWTAEGWIGGDPQVTPRVDTGYLMGSKLVPNYWKRNPSAGALDALYQHYLPNQGGDWTPSMGDTGYQAQIGLLPLWDALYLTSGADPRAYRAVIANAEALNSYAIVWNDSATRLPTMPSNRPDWSLFGSGQGGGNPPGAGTLQWEGAHHGSGGYLAYLVTGDYLFLETMEDQAATCYLSAGSGYGRGLGTARDFLGQTRNEAWSQRTVGQLAGIGPSGDAIVADYRAMLANIGARWLGVSQQTGINQLGYLYSYELGGSGYGTGIVAPWQQHFWVQTIGAVSDLEPFADMTTWNSYRDWMYRSVVGILGGAAASEYGYAHASNYTIQIADASNGDPTTWFDSWGTVYSRTFAATNAGGTTMLGSSGGSPDVPNGYWGNLLPAIAYAVDHGAAGADAAWTRLTASSNWSGFAGSGFDDLPIWGIVPRATVVPPPSGTTSGGTTGGTTTGGTTTGSGTTTGGGTTTDDGTTSGGGSTTGSGDDGGGHSGHCGIGTGLGLALALLGLGIVRGRSRALEPDGRC